MIFVFEDGRIIYDESLLEREDEGMCIAVETLPEISPMEGKVGYLVANLETKAIEVRYMDASAMPEPEPTPMPEPPPTDTELIMQALSDTELRDFEAQGERELLAQQMTDVELLLMEGGGMV